MICLTPLGLRYSIQDLCWGMWDLVPWTGIEPKSPELGSRSPSHWIIRKVPYRSFFDHHFSLVQSISRVRLFVTSWTAAHQASLSFTISLNLLKLMCFALVMPSNHLILCHPLIFLPSIFPSIRVFSNESVLLIKWPKYWSFNFSISPSNEYSGLISLRIDWFDLLAVQGPLKSLLQHHSSKASILQPSAFFPTRISIHDYWKNHNFD